MKHTEEKSQIHPLLKAKAPAVVYTTSYFFYFGA